MSAISPFQTPPSRTVRWRSHIALIYLSVRLKLRVVQPQPFATRRSSSLRSSRPFLQSFKSVRFMVGSFVIVFNKTLISAINYAVFVFRLLFVASVFTRDVNY